MPDETPDVPVDTAPAVEAEASTESSEATSDWQDKFLGQRKVNRDLERKLNDALGRLKEHEDADKTETEKAAARAEAAERALAEVTARAMRLEVATEVGLPADLHEFLTGSDEESLRSQAEKLKAATAAQRTTPRPDPTQGAKPNASGPVQLTKADLASMNPEQINQALNEGRLVDVLAGRA